MKALLLLSALLVSCTQLPVAMPGGVVAHATMVGGKGVLSYDANGRPMYTYNNENSLQHFFQFASAAITGLAAAEVSKAKTASDNAASVSQAKNASDAATAQKALDVQAAKDAETVATKQAAIAAGLAPKK